MWGDRSGRIEDLRWRNGSDAGRLDSWVSDQFMRWTRITKGPGASNLWLMSCGKTAQDAAPFSESGVLNILSVIKLRMYWLQFVVNATCFTERHHDFGGQRFDCVHCLMEWNYIFRHMHVHAASNVSIFGWVSLHVGPVLFTPCFAKLEVNSMDYEMMFLCVAWKGMDKNNKS